MQRKERVMEGFIARTMLTKTVHGRSKSPVGLFAVPAEILTVAQVWSQLSCCLDACLSALQESDLHRQPVFFEQQQQQTKRKLLWLRPK